MAKSSIKPFILISLLSLILLSGFANFSYGAEDVGDVISDLDNVAGGAKIKMVQGDGDPVTVYDIIGRFVNLFLAFIGTVFLIIIIYAGFTWMMAKGNDEQVSNAVKLLESSTIGLVIIIAAYLLINFVLFRLINISA